MHYILDFIVDFLVSITQGVDRFRAGWKIDIYAKVNKGRTQYKVVRSPLQRLFRGIRYVRRTEPVLIRSENPMCKTCGKTFNEHFMFCSPDETREPDFSPEELE